MCGQAFDMILNFDHHDLTAEHCYFRCSRSPDVDGIKIFDKDDQSTKHIYFGCSRSPDVDGIKILLKITRPQIYVLQPGHFIKNFCGLVIFIKNFDPFNIMRP